MMARQPTIVELDMNELDSLLQRSKAKALQDDDYETVVALGESYKELYLLLQDKTANLARLRKLLFGAKTEKTAAVLDALQNQDQPEPSSPEEPCPSPEAPSGEANGAGAEAADNEPSRGKGHGHNGVDAYPAAEKVDVPHESLCPGDGCPECERGTVYDTGRPGVLLRLVGQPPVNGKVYRLQKLRCNLCGRVFTASPPTGVGPEKYDATVGSMIALLKYGSGMPFNRCDGLQGALGIPLPTSTQWDIVHDKAQHLQPVYAELLRQAAQGDVLHNDDTTVKILERMGEQARRRALCEAAGEESKPAKKTRKGLFTSGVVSVQEGRRIALFFSGNRHAGENLDTVLAQRAEQLNRPIQMCDALARNLPGKLKTIVANCLAHARRQFVDVAENFPQPCQYVLEALKVVYHNDALARKRKLSPRARLHFHQTHSGPSMERLHAWLEEQFDQRLVEPNSSLGGAVKYMLRHWEKLTLFLREPGAPLDNNLCERALKKAILHRKNSLFYKTDNGARVGDLYMSLIYTCQLAKANPFEYLSELDRHRDEVARHPDRWMPWNYQENLAAGGGNLSAP